MAITYVKDIPDFTKKVEDVTNINELELTVDQLSASMLEIQGDVTELELTVSQLSASMLEVQGDVSTLAGAVTALDGAVDTLEENVGKWSESEVLFTETWGSLHGSYNEKCKLAIIRWIGNGNIATAGTKEYTLPTHYKPAFPMFSTMYHSTSMEVNQQTEKVLITFTDNSWIAGSLIYSTK